MTRQLPGDSLHPCAPGATGHRDFLACAVHALFLYALAEFQAGHVSTIEVEVKGLTFRVSDDGRGHAIERQVEAIPYLRFVYEHFDYPFGGTHGGAVQLQGIGMSLLNALSSQMTVTASRDGLIAQLRFSGGRLMHRSVAIAEPGQTGNSVSGTLRAELGLRTSDVHGLRESLERVARVHPSLKLAFNGVLL